VLGFYWAEMTDGGGQRRQWQLERDTLIGSLYLDSETRIGRFYDFHPSSADLLGR